LRSSVQRQGTVLAPLDDRLNPASRRARLQPPLACWITEFGRLFVRLQEIMRIILSRKGMDARSGGIPSPIFENGSLCSIPIEGRSKRTLGDLHPRGIDLARVAEDLSDGKLGPQTRVHLDPDLDPTTVIRGDGWRPAYGQAGKWGRHLDRQKVGVGDVFLFFGWFRRVEQTAGRWRTVRGSKNLHVLFGWLLVGEVLHPEKDAAPRGLADHPHFQDIKYPFNRVYLASGVTDGGVFARFAESLQLTDPSSSLRSEWRLPQWFDPGERPPLTCHRDQARWRRTGGHSYLTSVPIGQEFVLDAQHYPEARQWVSNIVKRAV
jgi:hypothetical protein